MSKTPFEESHSLDDELLSEYRFDYKKAKPNRFAPCNEKQLLKVVVLEKMSLKFLQPQNRSIKL